MIAGKKHDVPVELHYRNTANKMSERNDLPSHIHVNIGLTGLYHMV